MSSQDMDQQLAELEELEAQAAQEEEQQEQEEQSGDEAAGADADHAADEAESENAAALKLMSPVLQSLSEGMDLGEPASEPDAEGGAEAGEESTEFEQPAANDAQQAEGDAPPAAAKTKPAAKRGLLVPKKAAAPASKTTKPVAAAKENAMPAAARKALVVKPEQKLLAKPAAKADAATKAPVTKPAQKLLAKPAAKPAAKGEKAGGPKGARSAYMFFCDGARDTIKADFPDLTFGESGKKLGEMWKALSAVDKAPYQAQAEADKERAAREKQEHTEKAGEDGAPAGELATKKPRAPVGPTAFKLYCNDHRPQLERDNPKAGKAEIQKLLSTAWTAAPEEEKAIYEAAKKEAKAALQSKGAGGADQAAKKKRTSGSKRKAPEADAAEDEEQTGASEAEDDEAERMAVDWEAHPALAILSVTRSGKYVVLRDGCGLADYGLVDGAAAKMQRLGEQASGSQPCPVSLALIEDYERYLKDFKRAVHDQQDGGYLDLEDLPAGSLLDTCSFLGSMREKGYEMECGRIKNDVTIKVPLLGMSRVTQRIVDVWKRRALAAEAELAAERVGKRPTEAAGAAKAKVAKEQAAAVATGRGTTIEA